MKNFNREAVKKSVVKRLTKIFDKETGWNLILTRIRLKQQARIQPKLNYCFGMIRAVENKIRFEKKLKKKLVH